MKKYGIDIPKEKRDDFISDILSGDRHWRKILEDEPELRGHDYETKRDVEEKAQLNLGYEPNYYQNVRELNKI